MSQVETKTPSWLETLGADRKRTSIVLFVLAAACLAIPIVTYVQTKMAYPHVLLWGALLSLSFLFAGMWLSLQQPAPSAKPADTARLVILGLGAAIGLSTFLLIGVGLTWQWWTSVFVKNEDLTGPALWREQWRGIAVIAAALVGSLLLMFLCLQVVRGEVRANPILRLTLYGYNAVLSGLLLLFILVLVNVLTYARVRPFTLFDKSVDWSGSGLYTLSQTSINILQQLSKPVKVYAILPGGTQIRNETQILLNNCRAVTDKFDFENVSPDLNQARMQELEKKYQFADRAGLLVVYGTEPNEEKEFIPASRLLAGDDRSRSDFQGEFYLMEKLSVLVQGKAKTILYFTQGNGEPDLQSPPGAGRAEDRPSLDALKSQLDRQERFEVKELRFTPALREVPADAEVVVMVRPRFPLSPEALTVLRNYMNPTDPEKKKGRLALLLDVVVDRDGKMVHTGLESFLAEYNVQVGDDRIICARPMPGGDVLSVLAIAPPLQSTARNPLGRFLLQNSAEVDFHDARTVKPAADAGAPPPQGAKYQADLLLVSVLANSWAETNLKLDPAAYVSQMKSTPERQTEMAAKFSQTALPVAVTVTEPSPSATPPGHPPLGAQQKPATPRMVVFGDADWVYDRYIQGRGNSNLNLFLASMQYLRESPTLGKVPDPRESKEFRLTAEADTVGRMLWLPGSLVVLGVVYLAGSIWSVRRR